jgi:hypothetical protein
VAAKKSSLKANFNVKNTKFNFEEVEDNLKISKPLKFDPKNFDLIPK